MTGLWVLVAAPVLALLDAATSHRASRLWTGIPAAIDRRIAAACDLGTVDSDE